MPTFRRLLDRLSESLVRQSEGPIVPLGQEMQPSMLMITLPRQELWRREPAHKKAWALLTRRWEPDETTIMHEARRAFFYRVFGDEPDFAQELFELNVMHSNLPWNFEALTEHDDRRAHALDTFTVTTRERLSAFGSHPPLNLHLGAKAPGIAQLVYPMVVKIPVISLCWFVDLHTRFAFNEIRRAAHSFADELISYLYEILFLQQKTAIALSEYLRLAAYTGAQKGAAALIEAETDAMMSADLVFSYLKASVEKMVALIGLTHEIPGLDGKKDHKARMRALEVNVPAVIKEQPYYTFIMEFVSSDALSELNTYRTGLLHKRGIADLQPHNYVGREATSLPFLKIFSVLHEQHTKNSAILVAALALLTDELVRRVPPDEATVGALQELTLSRLDVFHAAHRAENEQPE